MSLPPPIPPAPLELAAFDRLRRPLWIYDPATRRGLYVNAAAVALWDAPSREAWLARDLAELSPAIAARIDELAQATARGEAVVERWSFRPGGKPVTAQATISAWPLSDGRSALLFEADVDVESEQGGARAETAEARQRFLAGRGHELRTPLTSVLGFAGLLGATALDSTQAAYAARIAEAGRTLKQMIDDGVDLAELDGGAVVQRPAPFEPATLLREVIAQFEPAAAAKGLSLRLDVAPDTPPRAEGDARMIGRIVGHYLANAIKVSPWGEIVVSLSSPWRSGDIVDFEIGVADQGPGPDALAKAGDSGPLSPADGARGLSIARALAAAIGAEVGVESGSGRGARVWLQIELPLAAPARPAGEPSEGQARPLRVLYADDDESNRILVQTLLTGLGHACAVVGDGAEAVEAVAGGGYDLVLMDIDMPGMDGVAAAREIRKFGGLAGAIPIVALTANTLSEHVAAYAAAGMNDCLAKPVSLPELAGKMALWTGAPATAQARSAA